MASLRCQLVLLLIIVCLTTYELHVHAADGAKVGEGVVKIVLSSQLVLSFFMDKHLTLFSEMLSQANGLGRRNLYGLILGIPLATKNQIYTFGEFKADYTFECVYV
ncbi:PREDICTED: uncharacterized protein LOC104721927 isoform X1 [Camelina sativa]|uniref:Uncharacterized protein LOC104721927 isoform X1 n=1 Tax=Camelina sativa TaxID=90675 RepID=A0ABM1QKZ6_CAMSA|nr:PREDICTED: uncharacterized protein LOC104721927 isoform X1 [Camelina sativa]